MVLPRSVDSELDIPLENVTLKGRFRLPENPKGIVLFSHGSGSSRKSPRNTYVAEILYQQGLGSLLFDLLTEEEDQEYENRFNIGLLTRRLITVTDWVLVYAYRPNLPLGYFGASTGAASALRAAAHFREKIAAVVCRGGRPDLAMADLPRVTAPTLFLVGSLDHPVIELNRQAVALMRSEAELELVPGATHLFREPGKLDLVAEKTAAWFQTHFEKKRAYV